MGCSRKERRGVAARGSDSVRFGASEGRGVIIGASSPEHLNDLKRAIERKISLRLFHDLIAVGDLGFEFSSSLGEQDC